MEEYSFFIKAASIGSHSLRKALIKENIKREREKKKNLMQWLINKATIMRATPTMAEKRLDLLLGKDNISHIFQHAIIYNKKEWIDGDYCLIFKGFIADFYLPDCKIIIEVDGGYHNTKNQEIADAIRDKRICSISPIKIVRIKNHELFKTQIKIS